MGENLRESLRDSKLLSLIVLGIAALSICLTLLPILASAYRGDDQLLPALFLTEVQGKGLFGASILEGIDFARETGRVVPGWVTLLTLEFSLFDSRIAYKAFLILMTMMVLLGTTWFVRALAGLGWLFSFVVTAVVAGSAIQFRISPSMADPYLSVAGLNQISVLLFLVALAVVLWSAGPARSRSEQILTMVLVAGIFALQCYLYDANLVLAGVFILVLLLLFPVREAVWRAVPILLVAAVSVVAVLLAREVATAPMGGYTGNFSPLEILRTQTLLSVSTLPGAFPLGNPRLLVDPTLRELAFGLVSGIVLAATGWGLLYLFRRARQLPFEKDGETGKPFPLSDRKALILAFALVVLPSLPLAFSEKYQVEAALGRTHLTVVFSLLGFTLAAGVGLRWLRSHRKLGKEVMTVLVASLFIVGGLTAYSNVRNIGLDRVGLKQREGFESFLASGFSEPKLPEATFLVSNRDFAWGPGNFTSGISEVVGLETGREVDFRVIDSLSQVCVRTKGVPAADDPLCEQARSGGFWFLALRTSRERVVAILSRLEEDWQGNHGGISAAKLIASLERKSATNLVVLTKQLRPESTRAWSTGPKITGSLPSGKPWSANTVGWERSQLADGWVAFRAVGPRGNLPTPISSNDPGSKIDFYADSAGRPARERVDIFGNSWLPPW